MGVRTAFDRFRLAGAGNTTLAPEPEPVEGGWVIYQNGAGDWGYVITRDGQRVRYARR